MPQQTYSYDWSRLPALLKSVETRALMSQPPPSTILKGSPLHELLVEVRTILPCKDYVSGVIDYAAAKQALDCEAFLHLGRMVHWLQQTPCTELHRGSSQNHFDLLKLDWFYLLVFLRDLVKAIYLRKGSSSSEGVDRVVLCASEEQLLSSGRLEELQDLHHNIQH